MVEVAERITGVLARTAGNIVNPAVTGLMQAAAIVTGNPDLAFWAAPVGAMAGSLTEEGATVVRAAWSQRSNRVEQFATVVEEESEQPIDELLKLAAGNDKTLQVLGVTVQGATEAHDDWKLRMLAKVFVTGTNDPARVDELIYLTRALEGVDGPEARTMAVIADRSRPWRLEDIAKRDPGLGQVALLTLRNLIRLDLVAQETATGLFHLTPVGTHCAEGLQKLGAMPEVS